MLTKPQAIALYGGSVQSLADALGYTSRHAVYMWSDDKPIPERAYLRLRYELRPDAFDDCGRLVSANDGEGG